MIEIGQRSPFGDLACRLAREGTIPVVNTTAWCNISCIVRWASKSEAGGIKLITASIALPPFHALPDFVFDKDPNVLFLFMLSVDNLDLLVGR